MIRYVRNTGQFIITRNCLKAMIGVIMNTKVLKVNEDTITGRTLLPAIQILKEGGLVAFPTETVYGLGADALDEEAAKKIYEAKGRPSDNPLIVHIADVKSLETLAVEIPQVAYDLAEAFWPGPLTMILKKSDVVPYGTTGGLDTVAIRMPSNKIAMELIRESGLFIAAPSANSSGKPSPTLAEHVVYDLDGKIDMVVDGGKAVIGLESTIIDLSTKTPCILRPGYITKQMLERVIPTVSYDPVVNMKKANPSIHPKAPGMKYKHYAPFGDLTIVEGNTEEVIKYINQEVASLKTQGKSVGVIATKETKDSYKCDDIRCIGTRSNDDTIAASLYAILREFDEAKTEYIFSESFDDEELGQAIMNRLIKASGYKIIHV